MEANASWQGDGNAAQGGSKMIPNEVLAAWIVSATVGVTALGGLSLLDKRLPTSGMKAEPLPFQYAGANTGQRLAPLDSTWKSRLEATGSLPARPASILVEWVDDEVNEMNQWHEKGGLFADTLATADEKVEFLGP
jgi:hypothetical protein